ncbi:MAG: hypothetical protein H5T86_07120, partial [Armatimonadetes bacterium]|nr:hypothetical protein [Armatimonadota bacterium]
MRRENPYNIEADTYPEATAKKELRAMPAKRLSERAEARPRIPVIGVFATCDPRIDQQSRDRAVNIVEMAANILAERVRLPDG